MIDSREALDRFIDEHGIRHFKVGVFDIDGVFRGKYVNRTKLESGLAGGLGFCDVVLGWDSEDQLFADTKVSGWHTGYRDAPVTLDIDSTRRLVFEPETLVMIGRFAGEYAEVGPRNVLRRAVDKARSMGFSVNAAAEYEFFLYDETPESVRAKGYRDLEPFTPGMFGYSMIRNSVHHELYHELLDVMSGMDCELEGLHTETGPGVVEAALRYDEAERAADKAALFKTFTKVLMQRRGLMATFMAKCTNRYPGQSGHIHLSLADAAGTNVMYAPDDPQGFSDTMRHFIAGQVRLMPEFLAMICSTINAYRRLVPGMWAPTHATWGIENRTTALRAIPGGPKGTRVEYRVAPADASPHLAMAAALASGLYGVEHELELPVPVTGSAYENPGDAAALPSTLDAATERFASSAIARECFGETFVDHFATTRRHEVMLHRKWVSDWDMARYFEII